MRENSWEHQGFQEGKQSFPWGFLWGYDKNWTKSEVTSVELFDFLSYNEPAKEMIMW